MRTPCLAVSALTLALVGGVVAQDAAVPKDGSAELARAVARAKVHNTRVLALLADDGENLLASWRMDRAIKRMLDYEFQVVPFAGKQAAAWAATWDFGDAIEHRPALVVLDTGRKVLARLKSDEFMADGKVDAGGLTAKLTPHFCTPVDAEKKLAAALIDAKKTGRNVFIRFDAPW